jgi:hypothetical protein
VDYAQEVIYTIRPLGFETDFVFLSVPATMTGKPKEGLYQFKKKS